MAKGRPPRPLHQPQAPPPQHAARIAAKVQQGLSFQVNGQLARAERLYREVLTKVPAHFDAWHLLGVVQYQKGQLAAAVELIGSAIKLRPGEPDPHSNLGLALHKLGRPHEALASYERALALKPDFAEALYYRGNALRDLERPHEALASYDRALTLRPSYAAVLNDRGMALQDLGRTEEALASYDRALALQPDFAEALNNRGNVLRAMKRPQEALASYDRALALQPGLAKPYNNRGNALRDLKRPQEALASYDRALALQPGFAEALNNRGTALQDLKQPEQALACYERALALKPDYAEALCNGAAALHELRRLEEAAQWLAKVVELDPDYPFARGKLLHARMLCCDWAQVAPLAAAIDGDVRAGKESAEPFGYQAVSDSPQDLQRCAEIYAAAHFPRSSSPPGDGERHDHARIRIGYVSGEFRQQATALLMTELFERHDRDRFELFAFDNGWDDASETRARISKAFDEIVPIAHLTDAEAAAAVRQRQIDILVNLNGYFGLARQGVFGFKPAPIQVNYLGFPGTLGVDYIDYIVADAHVIPREHAKFYDEKIVYLPDTYQANGSRPRAERIPARADVGLPQAGLVFCCFNNNYKITPAIYAIWMRLLTAVPGSVLWLLEDNAAASRNLRREAEQSGVAAERVVFAPKIGLDGHLARHGLADLFLDTLPCNAHTTASDALWAGLPVLTCMGGAFSGRVAGSLLNAAGLPEMITHSLDEYEARALELATAPAMLAGIRDKLARNRTDHALFDADRFRRHIESAYVTMWQRHRRGEPPAAFAVEPVH